MKQSYRYAVLSFCPDLTDPRAESRAVAIVGVGSLSKEEGFVLFVCRAHMGKDGAFAKDEFSRAMLNDLPRLLEGQSSKGISDSSPSTFLTWLHDRFRNSVHVSEINERTIDVEEPTPDALVGDALQLWKTVTGASVGTDAGVTRPSQRSTLFPRIGFNPLPMQMS